MMCKRNKNATKIIVLYTWDFIFARELRKTIKNVFVC